MSDKGDLGSTIKQFASLAIIGYAAYYILQKFGVSDFMIGWATAALAGLLTVDRQTVPERSILKRFWG
jgi:hypothetical protein